MPGRGGCEAEATPMSRKREVVAVGQGALKGAQGEEGAQEEAQGDGVVEGTQG